MEPVHPETVKRGNQSVQRLSNVETSPSTDCQTWKPVHPQTEEEKVVNNLNDRGRTGNEREMGGGGGGGWRDMQREREREAGRERERYR